jgi:uncharacterized protein
VKYICRLIIVVCVWNWPLAAQQPATAAAREDIVRLFDAMHIKEQVRSSMDMMAAQMKQMTRETLKERFPKASVEDFAKADAISDEMLKDYPIDGVVDDIIPVYQKHLTTADVEAMLLFYSTPTGQKLLREQPEITTESMQAISGRMQSSFEEMMHRLENRLNEDKKQKAPAPKKSGKQSS